MKHSNILDEVEIKNSSQVFTKRMIELGAFFGGPLAAGYLLGKNYKALGEEEKVGITYAMAVLAMVVYVVVTVAIKFYVYDLPSFLYGLLSLLGARYIYQKEQATKVEQHLAAGGETQTGKEVFKVVMVVLALVVGIVVGIVVLFYRQEVNMDEMPPPPPVQTIQADQFTTGIATNRYGGMDHMISYDREQFSGAAIDELAAILTNIGYFGRNRQQVVHVELEEGEYTLFMVELPQRVAIPANQNAYRSIKNTLVEFYGTNAVTLVLTDEAWEQEYAVF